MDKGYRGTKVLLAVVIAILLTDSARAGQKQANAVVIDTTNRVAIGSLGAARNSIDSLQQLACDVTATSTGTTAICLAINASGTSASCTVPTGVTSMFDVLKGLNGDSVLEFKYDASGNCTLIAVGNDSVVPPKSL